MSKAMEGNAARARPGILGWKYLNEIVEVVLVVAFFVVLDLAIPRQWGLNHLELYALYVVVAGFAARYGAPSGYVAGALSALAYDLLIIFHPTETSLTTQELLQPFLLFVGGIVVSEIVRYHQRRVTEAETLAQEATAALKDMGIRYQSVAEMNAELEQRIATQPTSVATILDVAKRLSALNPNEMYGAVLDLIRDVMDVEACSLYLLVGEQPRLKVGQPESWPNRPRTLQGGTGIAGRAVRERQIVTVRDVLDRDGQAALKNEPMLMAGPLIGSDGKAFAVVIIEQLPFSKFTPANIRQFYLILDWVSSMLRKAPAAST